jgi:hypothetical protein
MFTASYENTAKPNTESNPKPNANPNRLLQARADRAAARVKKKEEARARVAAAEETRLVTWHEKSEVDKKELKERQAAVAKKMEKLRKRKVKVDEVKEMERAEAAKTKEAKSRALGTCTAIVFCFSLSLSRVLSCDAIPCLPSISRSLYQLSPH